MKNTFATLLSIAFLFSTFNSAHAAAAQKTATQSAKSCARGEIYDSAKARCCVPRSGSKVSC